VKNIDNKNSLKSSSRIILMILFFEYFIFIISGVSFYSLCHYPYFNIGIDPAYWLFYFAGFPQYILSHIWLAVLCDVLIIAFLLLLIFNPFNNKAGAILFILLFLYYISLSGCLGHKNFQTGFFIVMIPFIFKENRNKKIAFESIRYFLLFYYLSASLLKLSNGGLFEIPHFSEVLQNQFLPYYTEGHQGWRTMLNVFLINNHKLGFLLYFSSFVVEFSVVIGFFTKKYDQYLFLMLMAFHLFNWMLMDIAPIGQLSFISILLLSKKIFD
jgi:hypothetical protein